MTCRNRGCKHNRDRKCGITRTVKIGASGCCESFEKGLMYYIDLVYERLNNTNMILMPDMTKDMRIGIYYVMTIFHLGFAEIDMGPVLGRAYVLKTDSGGKGLTTSEIIKLQPDLDALLKITEDFNNGILPGPKERKQEAPTRKTSQPFGWLSPTGDFTEGDFGEHEKVAYDIIKAKGFFHEFRHGSPYDTARDFLAREKGYVLIHNPTGYGGYIVSHEKPLTKRQKDFLYGYFIDIGDSLMANKYVD